VAQFALSGLLAALAVGALGMEVGRRIGTQNAIEDAKRTARLAGDGIVAHAVTPAVAAGDPAALAALDEVVRDHVLQDGVVRVKLWAPDGRIVYSDEADLIGRRFELEPALREVARRGTGVEAEMSELARPENRFEGRAERKLLEVYHPIRGTDGKLYLFEAYQRFSAVAAGGNRLLIAFAPALVGTLLLLQLINLPLARSLAGRLRRATDAREAMLRRALAASETERRTIAADLHDGVVQDLVSVGIDLNARADAVADEEASGALRAGAAQTRHGVRALRALLVDIYPPRLEQLGLVATLGDLAATTTSRGLRTTVIAPAALELRDSTARLLYRCAQEALRNAVKHARADHAWVSLAADRGHAVLAVSDDGTGFDPALAEAAPANGHLGLRAVGDLVRDAGGRLAVRSTSGLGTTVTVTVPLRQDE
jgi:two-component system, NarL family, sensor kinase